MTEPSGSMEAEPIYRARIVIENDTDRTLFNKGLLRKEEIRSRELEAVVDKNSRMSRISPELADFLGLTMDQEAFVPQTADRSAKAAITSPVSITIAGRRWASDCLVGPPGCEALIGQLILERLDLICDPGRRTVTVRPESPYWPTLKLKAAGSAVPAF